LIVGCFVWERWKYDQKKISLHKRITWSANI